MASAARMMQKLSSDTTPPAAITDLAASTGSAEGTVDLTWTAPGDDGNTGTAMIYAIKYATSAITTLTAWSNAASVNDLIVAKPSGSQESYIVSGLTPGQRYYFSVRASDDELNLGGSPTAPARWRGEQFHPYQDMYIYLLISNTRPSISVAVTQPDANGQVSVSIPGGRIVVFQLYGDFGERITDVEVTTIADKLGVTLISVDEYKRYMPKIMSVPVLSITVQSNSMDVNWTDEDPFEFPIDSIPVNGLHIEQEPVINIDHLRNLPATTDVWKLEHAAGEKFFDIIGYASMFSSLYSGGLESLVHLGIFVGKLNRKRCSPNS